MQEPLRTISGQVDLLRRNEQDIVRQIEDVSGKGLLGPCQKSSEPVLQANKIQRQVYHGRAFIGNHVHAAMKPTVVNALTQAPVTVVEERCPNLPQEAHTIAGRYRQLISGYAACSAIFSKSSSVSPEELSSLSVLIDDFLALCRKEIVERQLGHITVFTPQLHLLEQHTLPLMTKLGVETGLLGEHGSESIQSTFNNYESDFENIHLSSQRLKTIADQHLLSCVTDTNNLRPNRVPRKGRLQSSNAVPGKGLYDRTNRSPSRSLFLNFDILIFSRLSLDCSGNLKL